MIPRAIEGRLSWLLRAAPVVVVTGARGVGIEPLLARIAELAGATAASLGDLAFRAHLRGDPVGVLAGTPTWVLHDVHLWPELLDAIRQVVDRRGRSPGQFVLTAPLRMKGVAGNPDSLGTRAAFLELGPLTRRERAGEGTHGRWTEFFRTPEERWGTGFEWGPGTRDSWTLEVVRSRLVAGSWAASVNAALAEDLPAVADLAEPERLLDLLGEACLRTGDLLNRAALARAAGVPRPTAHRHLDLLERTHLLRFLPAYVPKGERRPVRTPRLHAVHPSLALEIAGTDDPGVGHLEGLLLNDLVAWRHSDPWPPQLYHWGTHGGAAVPFVLERNGRFLPVAVSLAEHPGPREARGVRAFLDRMGTMAPGGVVVHVGEETRRVAEGVWAVPWWRVA